MKFISSILGNSQRLDAGAMFGNVPKAMWQQWVTDVDNLNRMLLATRALLIQDQHKNILCEAGIGAFFAPKYKERFGVVETEHVLLHSLQEVGLEHTDIDVVIMSHLHFDHVGGLLTKWQDQVDYKLLFPKAKFLISKDAWLRAKQPHARDRASFIPEVITLLEASKRLQLIDTPHSDLLGKDYKFHFSNGHTPGLMLTEVAMPQGPILFASDLIPATPWVHLPVTMGYDRFPEKLIDEKRELLDYLIASNGRIFYTHDTNVALSKISKNVKDHYQADSKISAFVKLEK